MGTIAEDIAEIEAEITKTKYNKNTQHHIGKLKAKIAKLGLQMEKQAAKSGGGGKGYSVRKSGHATVGFVGFPSTGKSTLLNLITGANSEIGAYEFTTLDVIPGVLVYKDAKIQVLDMPGLLEGASTGKGRGKEVLSVARSLDLVIIIVEAYHPRVDVIERELTNSGIRLNQRPPEVIIGSATMGGISVAYTLDPQKMTEEEAVDIVRSYGLVNTDIVIREDVDQDRLLDALVGNRVYTRCMYLVNKVDQLDKVQLRQLKEKLKDYDPIYISAKENLNIEELKERIYNNLDFIRIYMKPPGEKADLDEPMVVKKGCSILDVCRILHRDLAERFRYAQVTGDSAKYPAQTVSREHILVEGDIVTIIARRA